MNPRQVVDLTVFESTSCSGITKKRQLPPSIKSLPSGENRSKVLSRADISNCPYQANIANRKFAIDQGKLSFFNSDLDNSVSDIHQL
jgi:hypothetical protein